MDLNHEQTIEWVTRHRAWRPARKVKPVRARALDPDEADTGFRTVDGAVERGTVGAWLCVGVAGEPWFQSSRTLAAKYDAVGEEVARFAFDERPRTYRVYRPKPTARVWAAQVTGPDVAGFSVRPGYDPSVTLHAPAGGYVVTADVPDPYVAPPTDVWVVQQHLFEQTYEFIDELSGRP